MEMNRGIALVTGGSHRVGKMIVNGLAQTSWKVIVHYHSSADEARKTVTEIKEKGGWAQAEQADLTDSGQISDLFSRVSRYDELRLLVNAAGVMKSTPLDSVNAATYDQIMDLNLRAVLLCSQHAFQLMRSGGVIINISDAFAQQTWHQNTIYGLSKAALEHLTRMLAEAYKPGVRVNAIAPAYVLKPEGLSEAVWGKRLQKNGRIPVSEKAIADAIQLIWTDKEMTGEVIQLPGGDLLIRQNKR